MQQGTGMKEQLPRVLLVDDSDVFRAMLRVYLKDVQVEVLEAVDGDLALQQLAKSPVALVVADLNMARVGGLELLAAMRAHPSEQVRRAAFVLITSEEQGTALFQSARKARVDGFVTKPVRPKVFRELVQQLLQRA
jgi:two-component system chemotaxis response regulator CheY